MTHSGHRLDQNPAVQQPPCHIGVCYSQDASDTPTPRLIMTSQFNGRITMRLVTIGAALVLGLPALSVTPAPASAQQPTIQRKVLLTQDLPIADYQIVMAAVEIPAGGREGRHTHPGALVVYIQEGALTF